MTLLHNSGEKWQAVLMTRILIVGLVVGVVQLPGHRVLQTSVLLTIIFVYHMKSSVYEE